MKTQFEHKKFNYILSAAVLIISWISVFNSAYPLGDDAFGIATLSPTDSLLANLENGWIPNRLLDLYGRSLSNQLFDFFHSFLSTAFNHRVDFFYSFKIYNATLYSIFITIALNYLISALSLSNVKDRSSYEFVIQIALSISLLTLLPWISFSFFLCYQITSLICFIALHQVMKLWISLFDDNSKFFSSSLLLTSAYVSAFSLESLSAILIIILSTISIYFYLSIKVNERMSQAYKTLREGHKYRIFKFNILSILFFSLLSIYITFKFATRPSAEAIPFSLKNIQPNIFMQNTLMLFLESHWLIFLIISALTLAILIVIRLTTSRTNLIFPIEQKNDGIAMRLIFCTAVIGANFVVTITISSMTSINYFSFRTHPWGGIFLTAQLFSFFTVFYCLARISPKNWALRNFTILILFILSTKFLYSFLTYTNSSTTTSSAIQHQYEAVKMQKNFPVNTGLKLEEIPMPLRPLPTPSSPEWFINSYKFIFKKYYGVEGTPLFY